MSPNRSKATLIREGWKDMEQAELVQILHLVQIVLAALSVMAGISKVTEQGPTLEQLMPGLSLDLIRLVGLGELLAGLGLVLPVVAR